LRLQPFFSAPPILFTLALGRRALPPCIGKAGVCGKKSAQKETSRPTGKMKYSTAPGRGQQFFAAFSRFFNAVSSFSRPFPYLVALAAFQHKIYVVYYL
jgi:hypothetical protein